MKGLQLLVLGYEVATIRVVRGFFWAIPRTTSSSGGDPSDLLVRSKALVVHTYRNAYGTHFAHSSTWSLLLGVYVVIVVGGFVLMSIIPVRSGSEEKTGASVVLWFGSLAQKTASKGTEELTERSETEGLWHRIMSRFCRNVSSMFTTIPSHDIDMHFRYHADMTQQLAASTASMKSYQSTHVMTNEQGVGTEEAYQIDNNVAVLATEFETESPSSRDLLRPRSRPSIFATSPPSPTSLAKMRLGSARLTSSAKSDISGYRTSRAGSSSGMVETREDFLRAVSVRQSIEVRAERRVVLAREDVSHATLEDNEMQVYEYLEFVRGLLDGLLLKKICQKSGRVVSRKLFITTDMQIVYWTSIGAIKRRSKKSSLYTHLIESVQKGIYGSTQAMSMSSPDRNSRSLSIKCSDGKCLTLEAKSETIRQQLYFGFSRLAQEHHQQQGGEHTKQTILSEE